MGRKADARRLRDFTRGAVASGLIAAMAPDGRPGAARAALTGGLALAAGGLAEQLTFDDREMFMSKKKRNKGGKGAEWLAALDPAALEKLTGRRAGLASLKPGEQFLLGALIGAGALYLLGDEQLRGRLMRAGMALYARIAGGLAEIQEQMADIQAEMEADSAA